MAAIADAINNMTTIFSPTVTEPKPTWKTSPSHNAIETLEAGPPVPMQRDLFYKWLFRLLPRVRLTLVVIVASFSASSVAGAFQPATENDADLLAKARDGALAALAGAEKEPDLTAKINRLKQGVKACDLALTKNLENDKSWAELCLRRSQLALELGNAYHSQDNADELKKSFREARDYAEKAGAAKIPYKKPADVLLALGNACEDLAQFARISPTKNFEEAAQAFDRAGLQNPEFEFNAGRVRFRWAVYASPPLDDKKKQQLFRTALVNLGAAANNAKHPHAPEACYWEGMTHWYLNDLAKAVQSFERSIAVGRNKANASNWVQWSTEGIAGVTRARASK